jgi:hypothetical protein
MFRWPCQEKSGTVRLHSLDAEKALKALSVAGSTERSPLAKAAAGLLVAVGKTTRGFESLPSPPRP